MFTLAISFTAISSLSTSLSVLATFATKLTSSILVLQENTGIPTPIFIFRARGTRALLEIFVSVQSTLTWVWSRHVATTWNRSHIFSYISFVDPFRGKTLRPPPRARAIPGSWRKKRFLPISYVPASLRNLEFFWITLVVYSSMKSPTILTFASYLPTFKHEKDIIPIHLSIGAPCKQTARRTVIALAGNLLGANTHERPRPLVLATEGMTCLPTISLLILALPHKASPSY